MQVNIELTPAPGPGRWDFAPDNYVTGPATIIIGASQRVTVIEVRVGDRAIGGGFPIVEDGVKDVVFDPKPHELQRLNRVHVIVDVPQVAGADVGVVVHDREGNVIGQTSSLVAPLPVHP